MGVDKKNEEAAVALAAKLAELNLDDKQKKTVEDLRGLDQQYLDLESKYEDELAALQRKYETQYAPLLKGRKEALGKSDGAEATTALKGFWLQVLKKTDEFAEHIEEYDEEVLASLEDISFEWLDQKGQTGWKLHMAFAPNKFFSNSVLSKEYVTERASEFDCTLQYATVKLLTPIEWKEDNNVTVEVIAKKVKGGGKKKQKQKGKTEIVARPSFFRGFFRNLGEGFDVPSDVEEGMSDMSDDEDFDIMDMMLQDDVEQGEALRDQIIPHAVRYFTGEACESDDDEDGDDDEDDDDEDDDESEPDDETDEDSDDGEGAKKLFGKKDAKDGEQKEECKQQ